jgi:hypothetical protein
VDGPGKEHPTTDTPLTICWVRLKLEVHLVQVVLSEHVKQLLGQVTQFPFIKVCPGAHPTMQEPEFKVNPVGQDKQPFGPDWKQV